MINGSAKAFTDNTARDRNHSTVVHLLGEKRTIVGGRAMYWEDILTNVDSWRQSVQRTALLNGERGARKAVSFREAVVLAVQHPAVVIAAHRRECQRYKSFGGFARPEGACHVIAEIDCGIYPARANVRDHRFQCEQVAMDIGDNGEPHGLFLCLLGIAEQWPQSLPICPDAALVGSDLKNVSAACIVAGLLGAPRRRGPPPPGQPIQTLLYSAEISLLV